MSQTPNWHLLACGPPFEMIRQWPWYKRRFFTALAVIFNHLICREAQFEIHQAIDHHLIAFMSLGHQFIACSKINVNLTLRHVQMGPFGSFVHSQSCITIRAHLVSNYHLAGDPPGTPLWTTGGPRPHFESQCYSLFINTCLQLFIRQKIHCQWLWVADVLFLAKVPLKVPPVRSGVGNVDDGEGHCIFTITPGGHLSENSRSTSSKCDTF